MVTAQGEFSVYASSGKRRYRTRLPDVTAAAVTEDGRFALAYTARDPSRPLLTFLDSAGRIYWELDVGGAVWSADASGDSRHATFVVGTGDRYVYVIDLGRRRKRFRRWRAPGAVTSVAIDRAGREVTFATWQRSVIGRSSLLGRRVWEIDAQPASIHHIQALDSPDRLLVRGVPNRPGTDGEFALLDDTGNRVSQGTVSVREGTRVLVAPNGRYICLAQDRRIEHKGKSVREKHAVLLDSTGKVLVDKGSLFFQAEPLLVTSQGAVLIAGAKNSVFTMTTSGKLEPSANAPAPVKRCVCSRDGTRVLLECAGGKLVMLALSP